MKKLIFILLLCSSLTIISSCSNKYKENNNIAKEEVNDLPDWVIDPSKYQKNSIVGLGIASPSKGGLKYQIHIAELDAKANIASKINSSISRISKNSLRSANINSSDDAEEFFAQATKEVVKDLPLSGVERTNIYISKHGVLFILMKLDNSDYNNFLKNSENNILNKIKNSNLSRENINKTEEATKLLFEELEKERK